MTIYIVATPIGNLADISQRALKVLKEVDLILCEDTRVTRKLLNYYQIRTKTLSYHQHSKLKKLNLICSLLQQGRDLALVSDAGTPGISDPGNQLIEFLLSRLPDLEVVAIPGPSALTAALSICGLAVDKFVFLGFPPIKKKRKQFFEKVKNFEYPVVIFESPYRIVKTLSELKEKELVVCRELTKKFERVYRGKGEQIIEQLNKEKGETRIKGEFVIIVKP